MPMRGLAAIGECMLELSAREGDDWRLGYAGDTFNTLYALRALTPPHQPVDYISAFGDDPFSEKQIAFLEARGIGIARSPVITGARPGLYAITLEGAERSFTYWRSDSAARQLACDPAALRESLRDRQLVYFSGITLAILDESSRRNLIAAAREARRAGSVIAFDPNYRPRLWSGAAEARAAIDAVFEITDIALPTFPDEQMLYGDASPERTARRLAEAGIGEIVVKNGERPALLWWNGGTEESPAIHVAAPLDTTGAGDAFNGAYLAGRLLRDEPPSAARKAHRVAAAVVCVRGALAPFEVLRKAFTP